MAEEMLKVGIFGVGHLGKIHLKCLQTLNELFEVVGVYDPSSEAAGDAENLFGVRAFAQPELLMREIDVADIVAITPAHFDLIGQAFDHGKHCFVEKPLTDLIDSARALLDRADKTDLVVQVGHVERYNPAYAAIQHLGLDPMFIEGHRLATYNPRGTDVSVVQDLMIHDLDILIDLIRHPVREIRASGVCVVSDKHDICNARIEFENGAVANLTASRISLKQMRKMRLFQREAYISVDFLEKTTEIIRITDEKPESGVAMDIEISGRKKWIQISYPEVVESNAIVEELKGFHHSVISGDPPAVGIGEAVAAMQLAHDILEVVEQNTARIEV